MKEKKHDFERDIQVCRKAIAHYGKQAQIDKAIEEMAELTKSLLKDRAAIRRGDTDAIKATRDSVTEEMADVAIMMLQLCIIHSNAHAVREVMDEKIARLLARIIEEETDEKRENE